MKQKLEVVNSKIKEMEEQVHDLANTGEHQYRVAEIYCAIIGFAIGVVVGMLCQALL